MADIEIVYRMPYCEHDLAAIKDFNTQCFTCVANNTGCKYFNDGGKKESVINGIKTIVIPFGDCIYAKFKYIYKGWSGRRYEMEEQKDPHNPHLDSMKVMLGNKVYDCVKVTLNGKCIYNEYDDEAEEENHDRNED